MKVVIILLVSCMACVTLAEAIPSPREEIAVAAEEIRQKRDVSGDEGTELIRDRRENAVLDPSETHMRERREDDVLDSPESYLREKREDDDNWDTADAFLMREKREVNSGVIGDKFPATAFLISRFKLLILTFFCWLRHLTLIPRPCFSGFAYRTFKIVNRFMYPFTPLLMG